MMLENIFPKIKLFLKERLKPFTSLYLVQKIFMEKKPTKKPSQVTRIRISMYCVSQKIISDALLFYWLICKFCNNGSNRFEVSLT